MRLTGTRSITSITLLLRSDGSSYNDNYGTGLVLQPLFSLTGNANMISKVYLTHPDVPAEAL